MQEAPRRRCLVPVPSRHEPATVGRPECQRNVSQRSTASYSVPPGRADCFFKPFRGWSRPTPSSPRVASQAVGPRVRAPSSALVGKPFQASAASGRAPLVPQTSRRAVVIRDQLPNVSPLATA